jgi:enoyl-[acyl-carrier protein] reductase III
MVSRVGQAGGREATRVGLVTGGSRGLGRAVALHLARSGLHVVINYRRNDELAAEVVAEAQAAGARAIAVRANLEDVAEIDAMFDRVKSEFGVLDVLVSNAAATAFKPLVNLSDNNVERTLRLTVNGFIRCVQRAVPLMEGRMARIVGVSGVDSFRYMPGHGLLGAAKAALESLIRAFAVELGPMGITVNGVCPGGFDTDSSRIYGGSEFAFLRERFINQSAVKDFGTVDDMAAAIDFLVSPGARFVTGQTIVVDGGLSSNLGELEAINSAVRSHEKRRAVP